MSYTDPDILNLLRALRDRQTSNNSGSWGQPAPRATRRQQAPQNPFGFSRGGLYPSRVQPQYYSPAYGYGYPYEYMPAPAFAPAAVPVRTRTRAREVPPYFFHFGDDDEYEDEEEEEDVEEEDPEDDSYPSSGSRGGPVGQSQGQSLTLDDILQQLLGRVPDQEDDTKEDTVDQKEQTKQVKDHDKEAERFALSNPKESEVPVGWKQTSNSPFIDSTETDTSKQPIFSFEKPPAKKRPSFARSHTEEKPAPKTLNIHKPSISHPEEEEPKESVKVSAPQLNEKLPFSPPVNIYQYKDKYVVCVALPGANIDSVNINFHSTLSQLIIDGSLESSFVPSNGEETKDVVIKVSELRFGFFKRVVKLPLFPTIDENKIKAKFRDGLLEITIPFEDASGKPKHAPRKILLETVPDDEIVFESRNLGEPLHE